MSAAKAPRRAGVEVVRGEEQNRFLIWEAGAGAPRSLDPFRSHPEAAAGDLAYFDGVVRELDRALAGRGLTFVLTWHLDAFEPALRDSIVLLIGDEMYQTPSYATDVRAIFKTGGTRPNPLRDTLRLEPAIRWRVLLRELRNATRSRRRPRGRGNAAPIFELPMGVFGLREVDWLELDQRPVDVFFAGSIESQSGFTVRPRLAARRQMAGALRAASAALPGIKVDCTSSGPFANPTEMLDGRAYSRRLMASKIALCPRGNFDETFRLCEAAKCGCVAITERLPRRWYNAGAPAIQLDRWQQLPATLEALLADPPELALRAAAMRRWWGERLSERAAAAYIVEALTGSGLLA